MSSYLRKIQKDILEQKGKFKRKHLKPVHVDFKRGSTIKDGTLTKGKHGRSGITK